MDHWGDPWADDADTQAPEIDAQIDAAPQDAPPSPAFAAKPIVLNGLGFLDEAGWGGDGNAWAKSPGWAVESGKDEAGQKGGEDGADGEWNVRGREEVDNAEGNEWGVVEEGVDSGQGVDGVVEETSDSATTIQADDSPTRTEGELSDELPREDDASTRSSTSPSDASHAEGAAESPRTSVEEERVAEKLAAATQEDRENVETPLEVLKEEDHGGEEEVEDDFGDFEDEVEEADPEPSPPKPALEDTRAESAGNLEDYISTAHAKTPPGPTGSYVLDSKLLAELFPPTKDISKPEEAPDDPIFLTSTRKTWYRLMRKQTMREYNTGAVDDNYIRITWKTSQIRSEVNKTVARWANEDRLAGRGPGARASFFWDTPAPADNRASFHARKKSSISVLDPVPSAGRDVPPLSTDIPAAFNWSSPSSISQAVRGDNGVWSTSSPITAKHSAITKLQPQGGRPASVDFSPRPKKPSSHKRTYTATDLFNGSTPMPNPPRISPIQASTPDNDNPWASADVPSSVAPLPASTNGHSDPWVALDVLDTSSPPKQDNAATGDEDEWGDMVESPAVSAVHTPTSSAQHPTADFPEPTTRNTPLSTPARTPSSSSRPSPLQPDPASTGTTHASPIVRLKGTVSPTSALFKPNALVPTNSEEKIGPHLLKSRNNRSREATPEKAKAVPTQMATMDEVLDEEPVKEERKEELPAEDNGIGALDTITTVSTLQPKTSSLQEDAPSTMPDSEPPTSQPSIDSLTPSWGDDADFSIFESSLPSSTTPPPPTQIDPSDPWSIFDSPAPPAPFTRPAARPITPPTKQPLTGATSSAQKRKAEEDEVVRSIVEGLPDLGYMLRR